MMLSGDIGIFGGSFNPVHVGHTAVAAYVADMCGLDRVLMMLSPLNPLKAGAGDMIADRHRIAMLRLACHDNPVLEPCDLELSMPRPSYTIDTLRRMSDLYPRARFKVIIGGDNWEIFGRWHASDEILNDYGVIVYPRPGIEIELGADAGNVTIVPGTPPLHDVSSTKVRALLDAGGDISGLVAPQVLEYIKRHRSEF